MAMAMDVDVDVDMDVAVAVGHRQTATRSTYFGSTPLSHTEPQPQKVMMSASAAMEPRCADGLVKMFDALTNGAL
ncbi:hypothetical protein AWZ03_002218 [Drosophila navojoa]|uniref:Uncharacterized protein n=1 Tax=Drosophila navojoa TaxID=7232 RepID=A0A484BRQ3_DRONA|nr:hypothetical protein AWZ03_002218 [Drosophila navojoa]